MGSSYPQQGVGGDVNLPSTIAQVLIDHNLAIHNALGIDLASLSNSVICDAYRNIDQVIPTGAITKILYDAELFDEGADFDADGVDSNFIVPVPGKYLVYAEGQIATLVDQNLLNIYIYVEGVNRGQSIVSAGVGASHAVNLLRILDLALGEAVDIRIMHDAGANRNLIGGVNRNYVNISKIGD